MSSTLEFARLTLSLPCLSQHTPDLNDLFPGWPQFDGWGHDGRLYLEFAERGASNCFDHGNRVARSWVPSYGGSAHQLISQVVRHAAEYVCGGMLCLRSRNHWTKPEDYIRAHRVAMNEALLIEDVAKQFPQVTLEFVLSAEFVASIPDTHPWKAEIVTRIDGNRLTTAPIGTREGIRDLTLLASYQSEREFLVHATGANNRAIGDIAYAWAEANKKACA